MINKISPAVTLIACVMVAFLIGMTPAGDTRVRKAEVVGGPITTADGVGMVNVRFVEPEKKPTNLFIRANCRKNSTLKVGDKVELFRLNNGSQWVMPDAYDYVLIGPL